MKTARLATGIILIAIGLAVLGICYQSKTTADNDFNIGNSGNLLKTTSKMYFNIGNCGNLLKTTSKSVMMTYIWKQVHSSIQLQLYEFKIVISKLYEFNYKSPQGLCLRFVVTYPQFVYVR
jgi:hypothetical protein